MIFILNFQVNEQEKKRIGSWSDLLYTIYIYIWLFTNLTYYYNTITNLS